MYIREDTTRDELEKVNSEDKSSRMSEAKEADVFPSSPSEKEEIRKKDNLS